MNASPQYVGSIEAALEAALEELDTARGECARAEIWADAARRSMDGDREALQVAAENLEAMTAERDALKLGPRVLDAKPPLEPSDAPEAS